jgi:hypothetical protein
MSFKEIVVDIFSEPHGGGLSFGRVSAAFTLTVAAVVFLHVAFKTHAVPTGTLDLASYGLSPYVANKAISAVQAFSNNPVNPAVK